jgi:hypothetical protein
MSTLPRPSYAAPAMTNSGGECFTPTLYGTRLRGPITVAWAAVIHYFDHYGDHAITRAMMRLRDRHLDGYLAQYTARRRVWS